MEFTFNTGTALPPFRIARADMIEQFEYAYFSTLVQRQGWENVAELARQAGVDRSTVYRIMARLDIARPPGTALFHEPATGATP